MAKDPKIKKTRVKKAADPKVDQAMVAWKNEIPVGQSTEAWRAWAKSKPTRTSAAMAHLGRKARGTSLPKSTGLSIGAQMRNKGLAMIDESLTRQGKTGSEAARVSRTSKNASETDTATGSTTEPQQ